MAITRYPYSEANIAIAEATAQPRQVWINAPNEVVVYTNSDMVASQDIPKRNSISGCPVVPNAVTTRLSSYFWAFPGGASTARYGEHHLYVPVGPNNTYWGSILGVRNRSAYMVPTEQMQGLFVPGLFYLYAACTKSGSWSSSSSAGAMTGNYGYSNSAGATVSATINGTRAAAQLYFAVNGGYGIVTVDGSTNFSSPLPIFSSTDYSNGLCRSSDVGKRYICCYAASQWTHTQLLAEDLSSGTHTVTIEVCGTKPVASSDYRVYVEAIGGCASTDAVTNANTYMVPIRTLFEYASPNASAWVAVPSWAPTGSTDWQFLTNVHADNVNCKEVSVVGPTVTVDGVDRSSPTLGTWYGGTYVTWYQESTASHKSNLATQVVNRKRTITAMANRPLAIMVDSNFKWLVDGTINRLYPLMLPTGAYSLIQRSMLPSALSELWLGNGRVGSFSANDDSLVPIAGGQQYNAELAHPTIMAILADWLAWGELVYMSPNYDQVYVSNCRYMLNDRSDGNDKGYFSAVYPCIVPAITGDSIRTIVGFGGGLLADLP